MTLGTDFAELAVEKITNGELWTHSATFTYGPRRVKANPWEEATDGTAIDPQTLQVAAFPVEKALEEGGVKRAMWEIYVPATTITVRPTEEDTVTLDGLRCEILSCTPIGANGTNAVYQIMALR
ncbi:MAG: hypothetical protein KAH44_09445 [Oricola sp.]|jgi:hypothetical protein|nr:hypothetical protein [Oricola sp.]